VSIEDDFSDIDALLRLSPERREMVDLIGHLPEPARSNTIRLCVGLSERGLPSEAHVPHPDRRPRSMERELEPYAGPDARRVATQTPAGIVTFERRAPGNVRRGRSPVVRGSTGCHPPTWLDARRNLPRTSHVRRASSCPSELPLRSVSGRFARPVMALRNPDSVGGQSAEREVPACARVRARRDGPCAPGGAGA
jgi:hypothetical protein